MRTSKSQELATQLTARIRQGDWKEGEPFPSQNILAVEYELSVPTVREALSMLRSQGYIVQQQGKATIVGTVPMAREGFMVNLISNHIDAPYYAELTAQIARRAPEEPFGFHLTMNYSDRDMVRAFEQIRSSPADGVILSVLSEHWLGRVHDYLQPNMPYVFVGSMEPLSRPYVGINGALGMTEAVNHLYQLGHRRMTLLKIDPDVMLPLVWERETGFLQAREALGLSDAECPVTVVPSQPDDLAHTIATLLQSENAPTALLAFSDYQAISLLQILSSLGKRVPEDISVIGFDGIALGTQCTPPLTTIDTQIAKTAEAVLMIMQTLLESHESPILAEVIAAKLLIRATTAPPPQQ
jgi:DNA-binding LacI/PurR family transcriptional regulator